MEVYELNMIDDPRWEEVRQLYFDAFPVEERRPWEDVVKLACDPASGYRMRAYIRDGGFAGFISAWLLPGFRYIEHFATSPAVRGKGLGSSIMENEIKDSGLPLILEVELPGANDMASRRIGFYERCGFTAHHDVDYIQPAYAPGLPSIPLLLMSTAPIPEPDRTISDLHRIVYGK